ncbi:MAG TPA: hypothetical protein VLK65_05915 [Vicinamibacteria bacterium]|nr:hypothetical protein [Vicinamibacteria bacterium]
MRLWKLLVLLLLLVPPMAQATTWVDVEVTCPVCGATNIFQVPASYGTYVFQDRSRFQYVFWPATTEKFLYTCRKCHLTAYMADFEAIPGEKVGALASMLEREGAIAGDVLPYYTIPLTVRLPIAEKVYEVLGRDDEFWCEFRRIQGYHLELAGLESEAMAARRAALETSKRLPRTKQNQFILASLKYFTGDVSGADSDLREAETLRDESPDLDRYLTELIDDFRKEVLNKRHSVSR